MNVWATRRRTQPPPPHVVWSALADPHRAGARPWLMLIDDEVQPRVIDARRPDLVVWSSLWPAVPDCQVRFELSPAGPETDLRWLLLSSRKAPEAVALAAIRHRLNFLINRGLRCSFGQ